MPEQILAGAEPRRRLHDHAVEATEGLECTVTLSRDHRSDCGQRQVFARVDDRPQVALVFGERVTLDVTPGRHLLRVNNTLFWKKISFAIEPAEHLEFILINEARWWTAGIVGLLGAAPLFLTVKQISVR
jgi:hypothetical protein